MIDTPKPDLTDHEREALEIFIPKDESEHFQDAVRLLLGNTLRYMKDHPPVDPAEVLPRSLSPDLIRENFETPSEE